VEPAIRLEFGRSVSRKGREGVGIPGSRRRRRDHPGDWRREAAAAGGADRKGEKRTHATDFLLLFFYRNAHASEVKGCGGRL
jgi:hypothetical protein